MMLRKRSFALFLCIAVLGVYLTNATTLDNRKNCKSDDKAPDTRVNTTQRLAKFREAMKDMKVGGKKISAFIVGSADPHNSEYPTDYDKRRGYLTGFSGSAGTAVITEDKAALWTDSRYFLEAEDTLDCNWILMKDRLSQTPSIDSWLNTEIKTKEALVGVDQTLVTNFAFLRREENLKSLSQELKLTPISSSQNPVDKIWTSNRPPRPKKPINPLSIEFAGLTWTQKITHLRDQMTEKGASAFVVTALDEVAWLFNLRGSDVEYNPVTLSYAIVEMNKVSLYILDKQQRLKSLPSDLKSVNRTLAVHLNTSDTGNCADQSNCVNVLDYNLPAIESYLTTLADKGKVWVTHLANYGIYKAVDKNRLLANSPIAIDKSIKNPTERQSMKNCYERDSLILIKFLAFLEKEIKEGKTWTEVSAATELDNRRKNAKHGRGISFATISSYGSNGAVIHYRPSNVTDKRISTDSLYLLDSGGQYLDGTTDVTRTMHYGNPTDYEKESYTRVLACTINLAELKWPNGLYGRQIDAITRYQLWDVGLNYRHGTGHGVGAYLYIHEGPGSIGLSAHQAEYIEPLMAYQFFSDEPGYYEDGKFGIRLETVMMIEPFTPKYKTYGDFLHFTPMQFVPFETSLIDFTALTTRQIEWLNDYNAQIRDKFLSRLNSADSLAYNWVKSRTEPIKVDKPNISIRRASPSGLLTLALPVFIWLFTKIVA